MTVAFCGHSGFHGDPAVMDRLRETVEALILRGAVEFLPGGCGGFDACAAAVGSLVKGGSRLSRRNFPILLLFLPRRIIMNMDLKQGGYAVNVGFAETLRKLREDRGLSQTQLGKRIFVNRSTIARWENGSRLPDATMLLRLAECLGADANTLFQLASQSEESPNVIMVDDSKVILSQGLTVLEEAMPNATITGFIWPLEAIEYAKMNRIALAVLDIELGGASGLELCRTLLEINPRTNIVFLTAYADYSLDAWNTGASGFLLKPLTPEGVKDQLKKLRYPISTGGADE